MSDLNKNELQKPPAKQSSALAFSTPASQIRYWLAFSKIYSIGTKRLEKLLEYFDSVKDSWHAAPADLQQIEGFSPKVIEKFIAERNSIGDLNKLEETILSKDIQIITMNDENYPFYLKQIYDPPIVLYVKGSLTSLNEERSLAVVGSRRSSNYIKDILKKIISELKGSDISIISGMAVGIDTCAHQAALDNGLNTIAVIGSGFDNIYPKQNPRTSITIKWDESATFEQKLERIITQKWIAMYPEGNEAWAEFRRTGYPKLFPVAENNSNGVVPAGEFIKRVPYPTAVTNASQAATATAISSYLNGKDNTFEPIWWNVK